MIKWVANLSLLYYELPFLERFAAAAADGFRFIEIQFPYEVPAQAIRKALDENALHCVLINVPAGDLMSGGEGLACVPERRSDFVDAVTLCAMYIKILKPKFINVLPGRCLDPAQRQRRIITLVDNLRYAADQLCPLDVTITCEAVNRYDMPDFLISQFDEVHSLIQQVNDPRVGMQFDVYHMAMMREPVVALLKEHIESIAHIQFADAPGRHEPDTGDVDFANIFASIEQSNYQGYVSAEYRPVAGTSAGLTWFQNKDWT
ncbi:MAG: TIM barrel protein [Oleibacter sp.]|nr:TIM barrel protein [Thalassolituus sp.]